MDTALRLRGRKGVSPIIAAAILILISVVAGVLLWLWVSGFTSAATAQQPALGERIKIEGVQVSPATARKYNVTAYVRNVGGAPVNITHIYILDAAGTIVAQSGVTTLTIIDPGKVDTVTANNLDLKKGATYTVKVVTRNGVEATYTFVVPK